MPFESAKQRRYIFSQADKPWAIRFIRHARLKRSRARHIKRSR